MGIDWRMGAEWFETCLLDYDPCSNYGNWTYGAGIHFLVPCVKQVYFELQIFFNLYASYSPFLEDFEVQS